MLFGIISALIEKKTLITSLVYNKELLTTKIKYYDDEVTDFCNKKIPKVGSSQTCLAVIDADSALKKYFYPQVFLKECKYIEK